MNFSGAELLVYTPHDEVGDDRVMEVWDTDGVTLYHRGRTSDPALWVGNCRWALETDGTDSVPAVLPVGTAGVIRACTSAGCPLPGEQGGGLLQEWTYFHCFRGDPTAPGHRFYCPPTAGDANTQDILVVDHHEIDFDGDEEPDYIVDGWKSSHVSQSSQYPQALLEQQGLSETSGIPYHVGASPDDDLHLFYLKQGAFRQTDGTLRYRFGPITLRAGTTYTWDLPDGVVEFEGASRLIVNGTLNVDGMTLQGVFDPAAAPSAGWAGIGVAAGATLRATGPMTIAGTTDPGLTPAPIDVEGTLVVADGGSLTLTGDLDLTLHHDLVVAEGGALMIEPGATLRFKPGVRLVVRGSLDADGTLFTEAVAGQGWGGIVAEAPYGTLTLSYATVEHAEVGAEVFTKGNAFSNTLFRANGTGISAGYLACPTCRPSRSGFDLSHSCVNDSEYDDGTGTGGYGIWARGSDVRVTASTVSGNGAYGVRLDEAALEANGLLVSGNGASGSSFKDGVRVLDYADLTLASYFGETAWVGPGLNSVHDNAEHEISITEGGYATVGAPCVGGSCPAANRVSEGGFPDGDFLIDNHPSVEIPAERVYWVATLNQNNEDDAFFEPDLVDYAGQLGSDPALGAGRPAGCDPGDFRTAGSGGGPARSGGAQSGPDLAWGGGAQPRGVEPKVLDPEGLDPETAALLRARLATLRAALAANPGADSAATLVGRLYGLQRLDRRDELGEHQATAALLAALHAPLGGPASLPPARRATAEAALLASVNDRLRREEYEGAGALVDLAPEVEGSAARRALALAAVTLDEATGDVAGALARLEAVIAGLEPEESQLARDLEATAAYLAGRLGELRSGAADGGEAVAPQAGAEAPEGGSALEAARPNPFARETVIPFVLAAPGHVRLAVYDVLGREVARLAEGRYGAGRHEAVLAAAALPAGTYLVRLTAAPENGGAARTYTRAITLTR